MSTFVRVTDVAEAWRLYDAGLLWWRSPPRASGYEDYIYEPAAECWLDDRDLFAIRVSKYSTDTCSFGIMAED